MAFSTTEQYESSVAADRIANVKARPLHGMKEICSYTGKSINTVLGLIRNEGFPAAKIRGGWESDEGSIDEWRMSRMGRKEYTKKCVFI